MKFARVALTAFASCLFPMIVSAAESAKVVMEFELSPAGNFQAQSQAVTGYAYRKGGALLATDVEIKMATLQTGIALRDTHLKQRLQTDKFAVAKMSKITGKDGKCSGLLEYRSFKKQVEFECQEDSTHQWVDGTMALSIEEFKPQGDLQYMGVGVEDEVKVKVRLPIRAVK